ncbi:oligosaccharide flippase family protein [bacterium]|jgi:O-antigen/teichoic acid export membrane protein|nr:oligosaccharide flippase family protein [bacterium]MBT4649416.1 oligosaccharide flippase family protein [bacterium]
MKKIRNKIYHLLRRSEKYTKTDMVYLTKGGIWLTIGHVISFCSALALAVTFANLLPKETYGTYKYIIAFFTLLSIPSLKKIGVALIQSVSRGFEGNLKEILLTKLKWGSLGTLAGLLLSAYYFIQGNNVLAMAFAISAIIVPFFNGANIYISYLNGKKLFKKITKYRGINQIITTIVVITTLFLTQNIFLILLAYLLSETITRIISLLITIKKFPPNDKKDPGIIKYGTQLSVIEFIKTMASEADKILIYHYIGPTELAIYAIAIAPVDQIKTLILSLRTLALPKLSDNSIASIKQTLPRKIWKASLIIIPIIIVYILVAPWLFSVFFPEYQSSVILSQILAISIILAPTTLMSSGLAAQKQIKSLTKVKISGAIGRLVIYFVAVKFYGLIGLIVGRIIIDVYLALLYQYYFQKMK